MLVRNNKIKLNEARESTIILSETNENFIILDDNTYCKKEDINKIGNQISKYNYRVKIVTITH